MFKITKKHGAAWVAAAVAAAVIAAFFFGKQHDEPFRLDPEQDLMEQLGAISGAARQADEEEYLFFADLAGDWLPLNLSEDDRKQQVLQYMNDVNALFFLGSKLELCRAFTWKDFQKELEGENDRRSEMAEEGAVYFGPDGFELRSYFQYRYSALVSQVNNWLIEHRDAGLVALAKAFYEENKQGFEEVIRVDYQILGPNGAEEKSVDQDGFRLLERMDSELLEFLSSSQEHQKGTLSDGRVVVKIHEERKLLDFRENEEYVVQAYLLNGGLQKLVRTIAVGNPVMIR